MKLISHRGRRAGGYPENTKEALNEVVENNLVIGAECDIRMSKDNTIILSHNKSIWRTVRNCSFKNVYKKNSFFLKQKKYHYDILQNIKEIYLAFKYRDFTNLRYLYKTIGKKGKMASLLEAGNSFEKKLLLIEIKDGNKDYNSLDFEDNIIKVLDKMENKNFWVTGHNDNILQNIKKRRPKIKIGSLVKDNLESLEYDYDFFAVNKDVINKRIAKNIMDNDKELLIWTVNYKKELILLKKKLGSLLDDTTIITDYPEIINEEYKNIKR